MMTQPQTWMNAVKAILPNARMEGFAVILTAVIAATVRLDTKESIAREVGRITKKNPYNMEKTDFNNEKPTSSITTSGAQ